MITYLAIVMTYLSISITGFLITVWLQKDSANEIYEERKKENDAWKLEVLQQIRSEWAKSAEYLRKEIANNNNLIDKNNV